MTPHSPEACARAGIPYTPEWRERVDGRLSNMEIETRITRRQCAVCEPDHSVVERSLHRGSREKGLVRVGSYECSEAWWRHEWRSMPDYDGGRNAPSGVRWARDYETGLLNAQMGLCFGLVWWHKHIRGLEDGVRCDNGRRDERGVVWYASWYVENFCGEGVPIDCFDLPSVGGRGWCPKLAEVE